ncbi:hypothetical protein ABKW28_11725 [Nocardioides sp. 31GB23]|uniref:hypothetical protein n=1 Tax=Nocardioides sp. 31GB23 TaxID=3156065 RepID=UPI0032B00F81
MTDPAEHAEFHASATVDLIGPGHEAADGWWAWLVRAVDDQQTSIVLEGQVAGREFDVQVPAVAVAMLLAATDDKAEVRCPTCIHPEGYDRLSGPCPTCHGEGAVPTGRAALDGLLRSLGTDR